MPTILLTGASGFIGRSLKEAWQERYTIFSPSSRELDLTDAAAVDTYLREHRIDIVVHCANTRPNESDPYRILDTNLRMFYNLSRCAGDVDKLIYFGSGAEYGRYELPPLVREEQFGLVVPRDPYGFAKYIMHEAAGRSGNIYDLCLFGVYGKHELWQRRFISSNILRALHGQPLSIRQDARFDYLYADDLRRIVEWFIERKPIHHHYNVCTGTPVSLRGIAEEIRRQIDPSLSIEVEKEGWQTEYSGDNTRLISEMGTFPFTGLADGIRELTKYYKENLASYPISGLE